MVKAQEQETETETERVLGGLDFFLFLFFFSGVWISMPFIFGFVNLYVAFQAMGPDSKLSSFNRQTVFSYIFQK